MIIKNRIKKLQTEFSVCSWRRLGKSPDFYFRVDIYIAFMTDKFYVCGWLTKWVIQQRSRDTYSIIQMWSISWHHNFTPIQLAAECEWVVPLLKCISGADLLWTIQKSRDKWWNSSKQRTQFNSVRLLCR